MKMEKCPGPSEEEKDSTRWQKKHHIQLCVVAARSSVSKFGPRLAPVT